jgi:hypothetical protein
LRYKLICTYNQPPVSVISSQSVTSAVSSGKRLDPLDNDQTYGAIVSPNKVLQLVPQPIVDDTALVTLCDDITETGG